MKMKTMMFLVALSLVPVSSRAAGPSPTCPCADSSFKPVTPKAAAVAEFWPAWRAYRRERSTLDMMLAAAVLAARLSGQPIADSPALQQEQDRVSDARLRMLSLRARAVELGGVRLLSGIDGDDFEVTLIPGVDFDDAPRSR